MTNLEIQPCTKACATASAVMEPIGIALGHHVNQSIDVRREYNHWMAEKVTQDRYGSWKSICVKW